MSTTLNKIGHSSYWLSEDLWLNNDTEDNNQINKIMRLSTVRQAISNFVSILSGENVPVYFQGEHSYTDGKMVVIAADDNPSNFDVAVGLALHEASHILLSDFKWIKVISLYIENFRYVAEPTLSYNNNTYRLSPSTSFINSLFREEISRDIENAMARVVTIQAEESDASPPPSAQWYKADILATYFSHIKDIMNILEDRRIDQYVYSNAMGYRPYYNALYEKYFYTKEASKFLRFDSEARIPSVENYINHMIYHIHPDSDPDALPGLRSIFREMDLPNVYKLGPNYDTPIDFYNFTYDMTPKLWQKANDIMAMIIKYVDLYTQFEENRGNDEGDNPSQGDSSQGTATDNQNTAGEGADSESSTTEEDGDSESSTTEEDGDSDPITSEDMAPRPVQVPINKRESTKVNSNNVKKELNKIKDLMAGNTKKKKITKSLSSSVRAFDEARAEMVDISITGFPKVSCMVTRDISEKLLNEEWFVFSNGSNTWISSSLTDSINAGRRMGQILHQRLQIRNDPVTIRHTRLSSGKIERRLLANLGLDNTDVFYRSRTEKHKPVMLHLTIDASGSMYGSKFNRCMMVATAIAFLSSKMENVECVISLRGGTKFPLVAVVFDSRRDHFRKWMKFAPKFAASGNTPEGLCFAATMDLILESKSTHDVYFINFSDGMPGFSLNAPNSSMYSQKMYYADETALTHTRKMVQRLRENGVKILSYFISDRDYSNTKLVDKFTYMYGEGSEFVDVTSVTNVLNTMNKLLMKR